MSPAHHLDSSLHPLKALYIVHGEEELLNLEAVDAIRKAAKEQAFLDREIYTADQGFNWQTVLDSAVSMSLFSDKKILEIHIPTGKPGNEGSEVLLRLAEHLPEDTVILICLPKLERSQLQSKWFSALARYGEVVESKSISKEALPHWLDGRLRYYHLSIEADALALFAQKVEGNLLAAKQEVDKLVLLYPVHTTLSLENIQNSIAQLARFDVFQLAESWMSGDTNRLMRLIDGLEQDADAPILLLWALAEDIRALLRLRAGMAQGKNIATLANPLRLWGMKKTLAPQALKRIGVKKLLQALQTCAKIDRQIKGAQSGNAWEEVRQLLFVLST